MMQPTQPSLFDYAALPTETALDLRMAAERIRMRLKRSAEDIIAIGQDLISAKAALDHGQFLPWVSAEFEMGQATAYNFIHVAERFGDELTTVVNIAPKVLYLLAAPSTPDEVVDRFTSGNVAPGLAEVKRAIAEAKAARVAQEGAERRAEQLLAQQEAAQRDMRERDMQIAYLTERLKEYATAPAPEPVIETREVRVEIPVIPPEVEQRQRDLERQLADAKRDREAILQRAMELQKLADAETQKHFAGENERRIRLTWHTNASDIQTSLRKIMGLLPSEADTRVFEADDWQKLAAIATLIKRLTGEIDTLQDSGLTVVDDYATVDAG